MALTKEEAVPGTKVKIPICKKGSPLSEYNSSVVVETAKKRNQDYLFIVDYSDDIVSCDEDSDGCGDHFYLEDLYLYEEPTADTPLNPSHYQVNGEQVWDQMLRLFGPEKMKAFCEVNAYKYFSRAGKKAGNPLEQDMEKCMWYLRKLRELENDK